MGKIYSAGKVVQGDFEGKYVLNWKGKWGIAPSDFFFTEWNDEELSYPHPTKWSYIKFTWSDSMQMISPETVDHYVEIGSAQSGPDAGRMANAAFLGGAGLGLMVGAASASTTVDVAIYCKNGKKFVVHFKDAQKWSELRSSLFKL